MDFSFDELVRIRHFEEVSGDQLCFIVLRLMDGKSERDKQKLSVELRDAHLSYQAARAAAEHAARHCDRWQLRSAFEDEVRSEAEAKRAERWLNLVTRAAEASGSGTDLPRAITQVLLEIAESIAPCQPNPHEVQNRWRKASEE